MSLSSQGNCDVVKSEPPTGRVLFHSLAVVNNHNCSDWIDLAELLCCKHRDAYAAVACRIYRDRKVSVDCYATHDIVRVVQKTERAPAPARDLVAYGEPAARSDGSPRLALRREEFTRAG